MSEKWELVATDKLGCADVWMLCDDRPGKLRFWVQGQGEARKELNKLNQLLGSGKISKAKWETKSDSTKPGKQYLHFQEIKSLQSCSTAMKNNFSLKKKKDQSFASISPVYNATVYDSYC